jgi:MFS family permease
MSTATGFVEFSRRTALRMEHWTPMSRTRLSRNRNFRLLWIGQMLSDTGSYAAMIAYPLLILALTHSAVLAGVVATVGSLVQFALRLPAGALADRWDRRRTIIISDSVRTLVMVLLATLVLTHHVTWWIVLVVALIDDAGSVVFSPAAAGLLPIIVAPDQLEGAWAGTEARGFASSLAGPALGGSLFALARSLPFVGDALSYAISVGTVSAIKGDFQPDTTIERKALHHEIIEGLRFVWRNALLRAVVIQGPLINFAFTGAIFTITLALRRHGTSPAEIGGLQAVIAVGGLLGAVVATRVAGKWSLSALVIGITTSAAVLFGVASVLIPSPLVALPIMVTLIASPTANASIFATMLRSSPSELVGRVNNTVLMAATGLAAFAPLTAGLLVQHESPHLAMGVFAVTIAIAAVLALALPGIRNAESMASSVTAITANADEITIAEDFLGPTSTIE